MKAKLLLMLAVLAFGGQAFAQAKLEKFPFRLNWTLYGEHAPFFVARDKGFYAQEGLEVEIQEGSGSTTVSQLVASNNSPVAYVDAATMMRGVSNGMPIGAVGVTLQQSPMAFIYRADAARPTKILNKQADALLGYFMDQGPRMQLQTGVKMGWTRLYDMAGVTTLSSAIIVNNNWAKEAKNQDLLRRFLRASQRGWQHASDNRAEAAEIFRKSAPVFTQEIALLEVEGTMSIIRTERTKGKAIGVTDIGDWRDTQDLLSKFAKLNPQSDLNTYFTNEFLSEAPYLPKK